MTSVAERPAGRSASMPDPDRPWRCAPAVPPLRPRRPLWDEVLVLYLACVGPVVRIFSINTSPKTLIVTVIAVVAAVALGRLGGERWAARLGVAVAAGVVVIPAGGATIGPWLAGGLVLADWAVRGRPPVPFLAAADEATLPGAAVLVSLAAWRGRAPLARAVPLLLVAAALLLTWAGPLIGRPLARFAKGFGRLAGRLASRIVFLVLGLPLLVVPWIAHRLLLVDPLRSPAARGTSWVDLGRGEARPERPWRTESAVRRVPVWARWRRAVSVPVLGIAVWALIFLPGLNSTPVPQFGAFAGDAWWPSYWKEMGWIFNGFDISMNPRFRNIDGHYFTVTDGVRTSWQPPACSCRRLTVWIYGGSALFGLGQRNDFTIPSDLARIAWQHGIALDVENKGVPGDAHWMEANRLAWDITAGGHPDLVLFYDGVNDIAASMWRNGQGLGTDESEVDSVGERGLANHPSLVSGPDGARFVLPKKGALLSPEDVARHAVDRYQRSRKISAAIGQADHVPIDWFWQPSKFARANVPGEPNWGRAGEDWSMRLYDTARPMLGPDVVDLTDSITGTRKPLFYDNVHTNELGAKLVADDMFTHLEPQLRALGGTTAPAP